MRTLTTLAMLNLVPDHLREFPPSQASGSRESVSYGEVPPLVCVVKVLKILKYCSLCSTTIFLVLQYP